MQEEKISVKHMGSPGELEEIERSMTALDGVEKSCCVFDMEKNRIMGFYLGEKAASDVRKQMKEKLPVYMVPTKLIQVDEMPLNKNGKTDRNYFKNYGKNKGCTLGVERSSIRKEKIL